MEKKSFFMVCSLALMISLGMPIYVMAQAEQESEAMQVADGVYEGSNSMMDVAVTVEEGKIADIKILEHRGGGKKYEEMILPLLDLMIERQSTDVDAITGATVSSDTLKMAVEEALEKARLSLQKKELIEKYTTGLE